MGDREPSGRRLSFSAFAGVFCEHCPSPKNCTAILVELRSSPERLKSLRPFTVPHPKSPLRGIQQTLMLAVNVRQLLIQRKKVPQDAHAK